MCAHADFWVGFDVKSTVHHIYFQDSSKVAIECNITFEQLNDVILSQLVVLGGAGTGSEGPD